MNLNEVNPARRCPQCRHSMFVAEKGSDSSGEYEIYKCAICDAKPVAGSEILKTVVNEALQVRPDSVPYQALRLDIGCGKNKQPGFVGVDAIAFDGVDIVGDVRGERWCFNSIPDELKGRFIETPFETMIPDPSLHSYFQLPDNSVDEIHTSHFVEHLTRDEWIPFFNEAYRVLKVSSLMRVIVPHFSHSCAWGDPTHKSFCSEWMAYYLNKGWRDVNGPHTGYTCDFDYTVAGTWDEWLSVRNMEVKTFAMTRYVNSYRDLILNLTKRPPPPPAG